MFYFRFWDSRHLRQKNPLEEESSGGVAGFAAPLAFTSVKPSRRKGKKKKKKKSRKENLDLSMVDEIMALIMERGILQ